MVTRFTRVGCEYRYNEHQFTSFQEKINQILNKFFNDHFSLMTLPSVKETFHSIFSDEQAFLNYFFSLSDRYSGSVLDYERIKIMKWINYDKLDKIISQLLESYKYTDWVKYETLNNLYNSIFDHNGNFRGTLDPYDMQFLINLFLRRSDDSTQPIGFNLDTQYLDSTSYIIDNSFYGLLLLSEFN